MSSSKKAIKPFLTWWQCLLTSNDNMYLKELDEWQPVDIWKDRKQVTNKILYAVTKVLSYAGHKQHKKNIHMYKDTNNSSTPVVILFRLSPIFFFLQMMEWNMIFIGFCLQKNTLRWVLLLMWLFSTALICWTSISRLYCHVSKIRLKV